MTIDIKILHACQKGDQRAQYQLYKTCFGLLMAVCMRYKKDEDEARASLNMGFLKILNNLDKYQPQIPFAAWCKRIMINTLIDEFRRSRKEREHIEYTGFEANETHRHPVDFNEADKLFDAADIERLVQRLQPVTQQVFNLFIIDGYSHKEIGELLSISEGTSKWHLSSARKQLQAMIATAMSATEKTTTVQK